MLERAPIRPAGKTSVRRSNVAWFAATTGLLLLPLVPATSFAQEVLTNLQVENGDVSLPQKLDVVENDGLVQVVSPATGNKMRGGNDGVDATLSSSQVQHGNVYAASEINGVNTGAEDISLGTPVYATSTAIGNYADFNTNAANFTADANQHSDAAKVEAKTAISAPNNAVYGPDKSTGDATVEVNDTSYMVTNGSINSRLVQSSSSEAMSNTSVTMHYSPSPEVYTAEATQNYYGSYSDTGGSQTHEVQQTAGGDTTARAELYGGNVWNPTVSGTAMGNNVNIVNAGGSLDVTNLQNQTGDVQGQGYLAADQYSTAIVKASGVGNSVLAGNNDVTLHLDNTQVSSGGVEVAATFEGNSGYDSYITANAVGNQAIAYACSECKADMNVSNNQTNNSDVTASATGTVTSGRSVVSTASATGNSALFYVSR